MIRLDGGMTLIGSPRPSPADQRPVHRVLVKPFWIDATHVTNREFQKFVEATNYVTTAERRGWSLVFRPELRKWEQVPQVNWRHPSDPESSLVGKEVYPVVHVSWFDAVEYATWAEKRQEIYRVLDAYYLAVADATNPMIVREGAGTAPAHPHP